ncbi:MAG TPA: hypothetical protein VNT76_18570, partial [Candidatus Binatus sp.]|nr:hypothetical protein [Candidatus Binatus sp.]
MLRTLTRSINLKTKFYLVASFFVVGYLLCGALAYSTLNSAAVTEVQLPFILGSGFITVGCFL